MTQYTHSFDTAFTSSVIDKVFYNVDTEELYVQLHRRDWQGRQVLAGYAGVEEGIYDALKITNDSRVNDKNDDASVGYYWNTFIKPKYAGIDTRDIVLEKVVVEDNTTAEEFVITDESISTFGGVEAVDDDTAAELDIDENTNVEAWTVEFEEDLDTVQKFHLYAADEADALVRFNLVAKIAGWDYLRVDAVTHHIS